MFNTVDGLFKIICKDWRKKITNMLNQGKVVYGSLKQRNGNIEFVHCVIYSHA